MRYWVKPDQLAKLNITVGEVIQAIQSQNTVNPAGQIGGEPAPDGPGIHLLRARPGAPDDAGGVRGDRHPRQSRRLRRCACGTSPGSSSARRSTTCMGRLNGKPAAIIAIYQLPGSNALDCRQRRQEGDGADQDSASRRASTTRSPSTRRSRCPRACARSRSTLWQALLLVILVVFVFLQGWRPTLIPLLAVPVSLIGTFMLFPVFGFSVNTLSLFGLVLAIGLVVDDAIVVVEAVEHHIEEGMSPARRHAQGDGGGLRARRSRSRSSWPPSSSRPRSSPASPAASTSSSPSRSRSRSSSRPSTPCRSARRSARCCCGPRARPSGPLGGFYAWFNRALRPRPGGLRRPLAAPDPEERRQLHRPGRLRRGRAYFLGTPAAPVVPARGGPGLRLRRPAAAQRLVAAAHERGRAQGRGDR